MLNPQRLRSLHVDPTHHPRGAAHLSAASGLVQVKDRLYVVADDELHLGVLPVPADAQGPETSPVQLIALLAGQLPNSKPARKDLKPDFETLALLPAHAGFRYGALLALGSGSRPNRERAVLLALDETGAPNGRAAELDLETLYEPLHKQLAQLNIEGLWVAEGQLNMLQRGNRQHPASQLLAYEWDAMAEWLVGRQPQPPKLKSRTKIALGKADGIPLSLTDGAALPGGLWAFSAVAENTRESAHDGPCTGSVVGVANLKGQVLCQYALQDAVKVEGISVRVKGEQVQALLVTDADDPHIASDLLLVEFPLPT